MNTKTARQRRATVELALETMVVPVAIEVEHPTHGAPVPSRTSERPTLLELPVIG